MNVWNKLARFFVNKLRRVFQTQTRYETNAIFGLTLVSIIGLLNLGWRASPELLLFLWTIFGLLGATYIVMGSFGVMKDEYNLYLEEKKQKLINEQKNSLKRIGKAVVDELKNSDGVVLVNADKIKYHPNKKNKKHISTCIATTARSRGKIFCKRKSTHGPYCTFHKHEGGY